jgi:hypothetical protein
MFSDGAREYSALSSTGSSTAILEPEDYADAIGREGTLTTSVRSSARPGSLCVGLWPNGGRGWGSRLGSAPGICPDTGGISLERVSGTPELSSCHNLNFEGRLGPKSHEGSGGRGSTSRSPAGQQELGRPVLVIGRSTHLLREARLARGERSAPKALARAAGHDQTCLCDEAAQRSPPGINRR